MLSGYLSLKETFYNLILLAPVIRFHGVSTMFETQTVKSGMYFFQGLLSVTEQWGRGSSFCLFPPPFHI